MRSKIGFFTGARSEYGIIKKLIRSIHENDTYKYSIYVSGIHLLKKFGYTVHEIVSDGFNITAEIPVFSEDKAPGYTEFTSIINQLYNILINDNPDIVLIVGDRFESYAASIACHLANIPIVHLGGGSITKGAVDNVYRYNISNLATYHFTTSKGSYNRLLNLPNIDKNKVFFTGSVAVDSILSFKINPKPISEIIPWLKDNFCVLTFHPVTASKEPIAEVMDATIEYILNKKFAVLITYPNNDPGYEKIINVIEKWRGSSRVFIQENLDAPNYYSALNDCSFVIGNSSSGIVEAPYFNKIIINVGSRQEGREMDVGIKTVSCGKKEITSLLDHYFRYGWCNVEGTNIFGDGQAVSRIENILKNVILT